MLRRNKGLTPHSAQRLKHPAVFDPRQLGGSDEPFRIHLSSFPLKE
jgi:hypothetical protein